MKKRNDLPNYLRLKHEFDIERLRECYNQTIPNMFEGWDAVSQKCATKFVDLQDEKYTSVSLTKYKDNGYSVMGKSELDERNYTELEDWVKGTYFEEVINTFTGTACRVRILKMEPGGTLLPHIDYNTDYNVRVHIPIYTNPWALFATKRKESEVSVHHMPDDGGSWFINQGWEHSAWNFGKTPRIHLLIALNDQTDIENALLKS